MKSVKCMQFTVAVKSQITGGVREYFECESSKNDRGFWKLWP